MHCLNLKRYSVIVRSYRIQSLYTCDFLQFFIYVLQLIAMTYLKHHLKPWSSKDSVINNRISPNPSFRSGSYQNRRTWKRSTWLLLVWKNKGCIGWKATLRAMMKIVDEFYCDVFLYESNKKGSSVTSTVRVVQDIEISITRELLEKLHKLLSDGHTRWTGKLWRRSHQLH